MLKRLNYTAISTFPKIILLAVCLSPLLSIAQGYPTKTFSVKDGLPSGVVYDCLQDKQGFMWFATDAGLARFDGTTFKVFTTEDGLTSNTILQILEDTDGSIWIFPFGKSPCIYDINTGEILNKSNFPELGKADKYSATMQAFKAPYGIGIRHANGVTLFEKRTATALNFTDNEYFTSKPLFMDSGKISFTSTNAWHGSATTLHTYYRKQGKWLAASSISCHIPDYYIYSSAAVTREADWSNYKVLSSPRSLTIFKFTKKGNNFEIEQTASATIETGIITGITKHEEFIYAISSDGVYTYNLSGQLTEKKWQGQSLSKFYIDRKGNRWYCFLNGKGVAMELQNGMYNLSDVKALMEKNITAIVPNGKSKLIMGDIDGNITASKNINGKIKYETIAKLPSKIRELHNNNNGEVIGISDYSFFVIENNHFTQKLSKTISSPKSASFSNDGYYVCGAFTFNQLTKNLVEVNRSIYSEKVNNRRVTAMAGNKSALYFGGNEGLFKLKARGSLKKSILDLTALPITDPVTTLHLASDNILWTGTNTNGIYAVYNNKIIGHVFTPSVSQGKGGYVVKKIFAEPDKKKIWVATNRGLQSISYQFSYDSLITSSYFITTKDGLADNDANDVVVTNDTVFVATINGINYFHHSFLPEQIPLTITGIRINNTETELKAKESYTLKHNQNNITIRYSGLCFSCDNKIAFQYRFIGNKNGDTTWNSTNSNTVELSGLSPDTYIFQVKTAWSRHQEVKIKIAPPFWQAKWFMALIVLLAAVLLVSFFRLYAKRLKEKQKKQVSLNKKFAELELRALLSQMNPHFIFNSMNLLQQYILSNDTINANRYLSHFSKLLRLFLEASRSHFITIEKEVELLTLYIELEQMRQTTAFDYSLEIEKTINLGMRIPSVILQPFVENAIVHGLRYLDDRKGNLRINMKLLGGDFVCTIEDNGVGRKKVKEIQDKKALGYKSYGTAIIQDKIETLKKIENIDISIRIVDIVNEGGSPNGTVVEVILKNQIVC